MCMQTQEGTDEAVNSISHLSLKLVEDTNYMGLLSVDFGSTLPAAFD